MKTSLVTLILCCAAYLFAYANGNNKELIRTYKYDASLKNNDTLSARLYFRKSSFTLAWFSAATDRNVSTVKGTWHFSNKNKEIELFSADTAVFNGLRKQRLKLAILNLNGKTLYGYFAGAVGQSIFFLQRNSAFFTTATPATCFSFGPYYPA